MFSEQTLDVFLVSPCLRRIILRVLIIEITLDEGHMVKTRHCCATQNQSVRNTKTAIVVPHNQSARNTKAALLCYTELICQNTKPSTAVHRTNLSGTQKPPLLSHTTDLSGTQNPPLLYCTEPIYQNTKPATAVLHRTNLPSICHGQPASRLLCFRFERRSLALSLRLCVVMAGMQLPT